MSMKDGLKNFALNYRDEILLAFGIIIMIFTITVFVLSLAGMEIPEFIDTKINTLFTVAFSSIAGSSVLGMIGKKQSSNHNNDYNRGGGRNV